MLDGGASVQLVIDVSLLHDVAYYNTPRPLHMATSAAVEGTVASGAHLPEGCYTNVDV